MELPESPNWGANLATIHMSITRGIDVTIEHSAAFAKEGFPDDAMRKGFVDYVRALVQAVDVHHLGEEEVSFPYLRDKVPEAPYDTLEAQHAQIIAVLDGMPAVADQLAAGERALGACDRLREAALQLKSLWRPHIASEEQSFATDILAERLTPAQHEQLIGAAGAHAMKRLDAPFLAMPFLLYNLPPKERAYFASPLPAELTQQLVPVTWKDLWAPMQPFLLT
ncbi:MAG: hemerythrin domain-containing protein [Nitrososphaerales archaeon]